MCLVLRFWTAATDRPTIEMAARSLPPTALPFCLDRVPPWPWPRRMRGTIYQEGGCRCDLLSDNADLTDEFWSLHPEVWEPLAQTLEAVAAAAREGFLFAVFWEGSGCGKRQDVLLEDLLGLTRAGRLRTKTCYKVLPRSGDR